MRKPLPDSRRLHRAENSAAAWLPASWDPRVQTGAATPAGIAGAFLAAAAMSPLRSSTSLVGTVVMALVVSLTGWFGSWQATLATAGVAWLMVNGFIEDRYGDLRWHGEADAVLMGVLLGCGVAVASLREAQIRRRRRAVKNSMDKELAEMARPSRDPSDTSGEQHD